MPPHINTVYALTRRAIKSVIGDQGKYKPGATQSLENDYGLDQDARAALYDPINDTFADAAEETGEDLAISPLLTDHETEQHDTVKGLVKLIMSRFSIILFAIISLTLIDINPTFANLHIQDINLDDNEDIVTVEERKLYFSYTKSFTIRKFD